MGETSSANRKRNWRKECSGPLWMWAQDNATCTPFDLLETRPPPPPKSCSIIVESRTVENGRNAWAIRFGSFDTPFSDTRQPRQNGSWKKENSAPRNPVRMDALFSCRPLQCCPLPHAYPPQSRMTRCDDSSKSSAESRRNSKSRTYCQGPNDFYSLFPNPTQI